MRGHIRALRLFKGDKAVKDLERPGGGPRERYCRVLDIMSFKGLQGGGGFPRNHYTKEGS